MKGSPSDIPDFESRDEIVEYYHESRSAKTEIYTPWSHVENFLSDKEYGFEDIGEKRAIKFAEFLKDRVDDRTASSYFNDISYMVNWYQMRGKYDYNPFEMAKESVEFEYDKKSIKRKIELSDLREAISKIRRPPLLLLIVLLLKTGIRVSEAANLDYRDINLDHPISEIMPEPRAEIRQKPNSIFIDSTVNEGEVHNGERRGTSNKKKSTRAIPIDDELKDTLAWWIAMAPPTQSPAEPLFRKSTLEMGSRMSEKHLWGIFVDWAQENGWHEWEGELNVTPHWCRHWFTTTLRNEIDQDEIEVGTVKGYVKGLRGDSDNDTIDLYTHDWGDKDWMRDAYLENMVSLFAGLPEDHYTTTSHD